VIYQVLALEQNVDPIIDNLPYQERTMQRCYISKDIAPLYYLPKIPDLSKNVY